MIFEALQSEIFRLKFHTLNRKILKMPEFNLIIHFQVSLKILKIPLFNLIIHSKILRILEFNQSWIFRKVWKSRFLVFRDWNGITLDVLIEVVRFKVDFTDVDFCLREISLGDSLSNFFRSPFMHGMNSVKFENFHFKGKFTILITRTNFKNFTISPYIWFSKTFH